MVGLSMNSPVLCSANPIKLSPLPQKFYLKDTLAVARSLLGKGLFVLHKTTPLLVEIVEAEAYLDQDAASHSFRGKSPRNWPMFEGGGTCYVYLSYGVNYCMNVVTQEQGRGEAVLLRAAVPLEGIDTMAGNRALHFTRDSQSPRALLSGPGKLTQALGVNMSHNGRTFFEDDLKIVDLGKEVPAHEIAESPRVGISKATEKRYRFFIKNSPWLSRRA